MSKNKGTTLLILKKAMRYFRACDAAQTYLNRMPFNTLEQVWCNWGNGESAGASYWSSMITPGECISWVRWIMDRLMTDIGVNDYDFPSINALGPDNRCLASPGIGDLIRESIPLHVLEDALIRWAKLNRRGTYLMGSR